MIFTMVQKSSRAGHVEATIMLMNITIIPLPSEDNQKEDTMEVFAPPYCTSYVRKNHHAADECFHSLPDSVSRRQTI